ncbi:Arb2 domain-containing protein [Staphylotrichum tortipilum]|uniref:Arb2 domain-containing protein n=1 Tax=Staphylotrichum tortipilum TaxID=2831512 RepID=A0AAN6MJT3_9PEZI|nr:Arb2 domain-containing protein [Staphylotrichum longicolle]
MFRRRWSGLPADPVFGPRLQDLGYFINDIDEIRSIEDSDYYFKYFLTKNTRWNERQRFVFNNAVTKIIHTRLETAGLTKLPLPLGAPTTGPHVPIFTSTSLATKSRVVLFFGEPYQALGVLAHRVIGGCGGITRGSALGFVHALCGQQSSAADASPPGVVLTNPGELWWWPEGGKGLTPLERHMVPMASAVHYGRYHNPRVNEVPGQRSVAEHVREVFETVVMGGLVDKEARVDVIALGSTADDVELYLDDDAVWAKVGARLNSLAILGGCHSSSHLRCEGFKRFLEERARAYVIHHTPLDTPISGAGGNPGAGTFTSFGCPVYSAGEAQVTETIFIEAQPAVLRWIQQVALEEEAYKNEVLEIFGEEGNGITSEELDLPWGAPEPETAEAGDQMETNGTGDGVDNVEGRVQNSNGEPGSDQIKATDNSVEVPKTDIAAKEDTPKAMQAEASNDKAAKSDGKPIKSDTNHKPNFSPLEPGLEAKDMVELVAEIEDLKLHH